VRLPKKLADKLEERPQSCATRHTAQRKHRFQRIGTAGERQPSGTYSPGR
jgi:hypothetical protein